MERLLYLAAAALVAMLILVPSAFAAQEMMVEQTMEMERTILQPTGGPSIGGGPAVIVPAAAALLLGSGVLAYAVIRRRQ